jgi:tetratricopeptide (TPR) repeat protein
MAEYAVARLGEIEEMDDGRCPYRPVRHHFGITTFGATTWTARAAGDRLINEHDEDDDHDGNGAHELYLVVSGEARFELDGDTVDAGPGTFVSVPGGITRTAFAQSAGTTVLAVGGSRPGKPYRPDGWELWSPLGPLFEAGRHAELVERARRLLERGPGYGMVFYNVACSESLLGRTDDALADLRRAVELQPALAEYAAEDEDLAAIRDAPAFAEVIAGANGEGRGSTGA